MIKTNHVQFRYYLHPSNRLQTSRAEADITHEDYEDMIQKIHEFVEGRINIPGSWTVQMYPSGAEITEDTYEYLGNRAKMVVTIDNRGSLSVGGEDNSLAGGVNNLRVSGNY